MGDQFCRDENWSAQMAIAHARNLAELDCDVLAFSVIIHCG
jgi:hypothetical protein